MLKRKHSSWFQSGQKAAVFEVIHRRNMLLYCTKYAALLYEICCFTVRNMLLYCRKYAALLNEICCFTVGNMLHYCTKYAALQYEICCFTERNMLLNAYLRSAECR